MNKGKDIHEYIELALDTGFCHIDTAQGDLNFCSKIYAYLWLNSVQK